MYSIIFPYKYRDSHCEKILNWNIEYYKGNIDNTEIVIGEDNSELFSRSKAINNGVSKAKYDNLIIVDIDIIIQSDIIKKAFDALNQYSYIIPYNIIHKIDYISTLNIINSNNYTFPHDYTIEKIHSHHDSLYAGGIQCIKKNVFCNIGGYDERFQGWGAEDYAFCIKVQEKHGSGHTLNNIIVHLWHEEQASKKDYLTNRKNFNKQLYKREYKKRKRSK